MGTSKRIGEKNEDTKTVSLSVPSGVAAAIRKELRILNKKEFGSPVRAGHLIERMLSEVTDSIRHQLQENTLSNADKLELSYRNYCAKNGFIVKDQFLGKVIAGEVGLDKETPGFLKLRPREEAT